MKGKDISDLERLLLNEYCPDFWAEFDLTLLKQCERSRSDFCKDFLSLFHKLHERLKPWLIERTPRFLLFIKAALTLNKPKAFAPSFETIYESSFAAYRQLNNKEMNISKDFDDTAEEGDEEVTDCPGCEEKKENCKCEIILETFSNLSGILKELDLVEQLANPAIIGVLYNKLTNYIQNECRGEFFKSCIERVMKWMEECISPWLRYIIQDDGAASNDESDDECLTIEQWKPRLEYFIYKLFAELRISELFEIIVEYPDSLPAVNDLKECLAKTESRKLLTESLQDAFEKRLLHPAVNTDDILTQYVSAIRTLRELDPAGIILENVCLPLREYLRSRDDTIRCIITCLTDQESGPDLAEELFGSEAAHLDATEDESDGEDWTPDPIDAKTELSSKSQRTADIINILVNIYGSKDMFVSQYRILLADRILTNFSYEVVNERRYLELLKRRFGENHLHFCDIMLKDVMDSQRINRHIKNEMKKEDKFGKEDEQVDFNAFILSSAFWPSLAEDTVEPPEGIKQIMTDYTESFQRQKGMRTLEWLNNLGNVEVEIELDDGKKTFHASPAQATIILMFEKKEEWSLADLSKEMNMNSTTLRNRISFWVGQGVIIEKQNDFFITAQSFQANTHESAIYESDDESATASSQSQRDEELQVYWSYVTGMLTNIGSLPLERIHSMLKMFAIHGSSSTQCTVDEVKTFLQSKVADGELNYVGGMYRLPKS